MSAAEELFLENGYNLTTTTMIAGKAGVTHAMLHYYFRTKEHIFIKVLDKNMEELLASFQPVMKKDAPFWDNRERIRGSLEKIMGFHYKMIQKEMDAGRIRRTDPLQLILDVITLNLSSFMLLQAARKLFPGMKSGADTRILADRKKEIITLIKSRLYGNDMD